MSGSGKKAEPDMDEILASIKKIIAEEPETDEGVLAPVRGFAPSEIDASLDSLLNEMGTGAQPNAPVPAAPASPRAPSAQEFVPVPPPEAPFSSNDTVSDTIAADDSSSASSFNDPSLMANASSQTPDVAAIRARARQAAGLGARQSVGPEAEHNSDAFPDTAAAPIGVDPVMNGHQPSDAAGDPLASGITHPAAPVGVPLEQPGLMGQQQEGPAVQHPSSLPGGAGEVTSLPPVSGIAGRTLEDAVAELLRPMLREWLDNNLPRIVEKIAKEDLAAQGLPPSDKAS